MSRPSLIAHGGWPFLIASIIGRLPAATIQLGLLMYVSGVGLGYGLGGLTVAAVGLGTALSSTLMGRLIDTWGPLPVLVVNTLVQVAALFGVHLMTPALVSGSLGSWALLLIAGVAGFANPQVGPIVRSHWSHLARERREPALVRNALGYESAVDEMSFIVGPIVAGLLVGVLGPTAALFWLIAFVIAGQGVFIAYLWLDRANWRHHTRGGQIPLAGDTKLPMGELIAPMIVLLSVGITFGATQTALNAVNDSRGTPELTGIIYGSVGIGSAITALLTPRLPESIGLGRRLLFGSLGLLAGGLCFTLLHDVGLWLVLVGIALGFAIGVVLVTGFARAEAVAPPSRVASAMTMLAMCLTLGVSIGAAVSGQLADVPQRGFLPVIVAGALASIAGVLIGMARNRARGQNEV